MRVSIAALTHGNSWHRSENQDCALGFVNHQGKYKFVNPQVLDGSSPVVPLSGSQRTDGQSIVASHVGACVIDGIAGDEGGYAAAYEAVRGYYEACHSMWARRYPKMRDFHRLCFSKMVERFRKGFDDCDPGAALAMALVHEKGVRIAYAGDCRVYLLRRSAHKVLLLSRDHSEERRLADSSLHVCNPVVFDAIDRGESPMYGCVQKNAVPDDLDERMFELRCRKDGRKLYRGDVLALMTDGAYYPFRGLDDAGRRRRNALFGILGRKRSARTLCKNVIDHALENGTTDNATVAIIKVF